MGPTSYRVASETPSPLADVADLLSTVKTHRCTALVTQSPPLRTLTCTVGLRAACEGKPCPDLALLSHTRHTLVPTMVAFLCLCAVVL